MKLIKTKSFDLAIYSKGKRNISKLALVLPGRLDTKDYLNMRSHVNFLSVKGFFALSFDPPGTWQSPGDISLYTMTNYLKAISELIEYFGNKPTFLVGHSRGGSMAMLAGTTNEKVNSFVSIMGSYSYKPGSRNYPDKKWREKGYLVNKRDIPGSKELKEYKLPYSFYEDQIQYDMSEGLKNCGKPKMFIYGKKDITVDPKLVKKAYALSAEPKELFELPWDHDYRRNPRMIEKVNFAMGKFLDKYSNEN